MKNTMITLIVIFTGIFAISAQASHMVNGYTRSNGTYVAPHQSMDPGEARSSGYSYHNNERIRNNY